MSSAPSKVFPKKTGASDLLHSPFYPADVRPGDPVEATVRCVVDGKAITARLGVWRISPFGVELVESPQSEPLKVGAEIDLQLKLGHQTADFQGLVVRTRHQSQGHSLLGIRWHQARAEAPYQENRRAGPRWMTGAEFMPTGVASNPVRFNDFIHFRVQELSRDGMLIHTSLRNKFIVPGLQFDSLLSFPAVGQVQLSMQVVHARVVSHEGKEYLALGIKLPKPSGLARQVMAQYLLQFGPTSTPEELRAAGLEVQSSARAMDFSFVRTADEYRDVLELRRLAYASAKKVPQDATVEQMADIFDSRARILVGRYRGVPVATLRLMFHEPDDQLEHEQFAALPPEFPRKDEMIEITRVCTHPAYRGSDLVVGLFKHALLTCVQSKRRWVIGSATAKLLPMYTRLGFEVTSVTYRHAALGNEEHRIFIGDVHGGLTGAKVGPFLWNAMFADIWSYLDVSSYVEVSSVVRTRLLLYRLCRPLMHLWLRRAARPRAAKKGA